MVVLFSDGVFSFILFTYLLVSVNILQTFLPGKHGDVMVFHFPWWRYGMEVIVVSKSFLYKERLPFFSLVINVVTEVVLAIATVTTYRAAG